MATNQDIGGFINEKTFYVNNTNNRGCMVVGNINYKYGV